uniref:Uncharacterized protein n=1 Tax=Arundo donax TaxID=35708 RepID=A0A0A9GWU6_ARUDO
MMYGPSYLDWSFPTDRGFASNFSTKSPDSKAFGTTFRL